MVSDDKDGRPSEDFSRSTKRGKPHGDEAWARTSQKDRRKLVSADYTVGWICAINTEYCKVGKHNVVVAVLPRGEYGISSATGVARDMLHTFPNIRIGLMVGIGGGAPSQKNDIRLGDVVVSAPGARNGGVFQYDFGKTIEGRTFLTTGCLDQPPSFLRAAISGLEAEYEAEGHQLEADINHIFEDKPRLRKKYKRPNPSSDRLYRTGVIHSANSETSCEAYCGTDATKLISRSQRGEDEDNPAIHYGLIASASSLMKDASIRDKLAAEKDVLCFETEAAGLMNHFPCLVIRGICDYSDSHKNNVWQGYAAMAAAAYARDLLRRIPPNNIDADKKISDMAAHIYHYMNNVCNALPPQVDDKISKCQPVFFQDALGRSIQLPPEFCVSMAKLQRHLEILFEDMPGHKKVVKKEYELEDAADSTMVSASNWHLKVTAGTKLVMSMLFHLASRSVTPAAQNCPRCDTINNGCNARQGMTECFNCKLIFKLVEKEYAHPFCDYTSDQPVLEPGGSNESKTQRRSDRRHTEEDAFRRIHYYGSLKNHQNSPTHEKRVKKSQLCGVARCSNCYYAISSDSHTPYWQCCQCSSGWFSVALDDFCPAYISSGK